MRNVIDGTRITEEELSHEDEFKCGKCGKLLEFYYNGSDVGSYEATCRKCGMKYKITATTFKINVVSV